MTKQSFVVKKAISQLATLIELSKYEWFIEKNINHRPRVIPIFNGMSHLLRVFMFMFMFWLSPRPHQKRYRPENFTTAPSRWVMKMVFFFFWNFHFFPLFPPLTPFLAFLPISTYKHDFGVYAHVFGCGESTGNIFKLIGLTWLPDFVTRVAKPPLPLPF